MILGPYPYKDSDQISPDIMYYILKLCIQNNLPNITKCEYRIKKMKSEYTTF